MKQRVLCSISLCIVLTLLCGTGDYNGAGMEVITAAVEGITRKKVNPKYEGYLHGAGMILLLGLMAAILLKDIFVIIRG